MTTPNSADPLKQTDIDIEALRNSATCAGDEDVLALIDAYTALLDRLDRAEAAAGAVPEGAITGDEVTALAHKLIRELTTELGECEDDEALNYCARGIGSLNADILTFIKNRAAPPAQGLPATPETCQCPACLNTGLHASDCAVHNAPAYANGPCDCSPPAAASSEPVAWKVGLVLYLTREQAEATVRNPDLTPRPLVYGDIATPPAKDAGTGELRERIAEAWANYERMGEICSFEGEPMIYASTLREIAELANSGRTDDGR